MITIVLSNKIYIKGLNLEHQKVIRKALTLPNPVYSVMKGMGKSTFNTPKEFEYYSYKDGWFCVPRGVIKRIMKFVKRTGIPYTFTEKLRNELCTEPPSFIGILRDYQQEVVQKVIVSGESGLIHAGTGTGKTIMGINLLAKLGLKTTILVPTINILQQWVSECEKFLNYTPGIIGNGKREIKDITIATFQTLIKDEVLLERLGRNTSCLMVDEVHMAITEKRIEVITSFNPQKIFGLSATMKRTDKQDPAIQFYFGPILTSYDSTLLKPNVYQISSGSCIPVKENYHEMIDIMIQDENRMRGVVFHILDQMLKGRKTLVLTKRIEHYQKIKECLPQRDDIFTIDSGSKDSLAMLTLMKQNLVKYQVILGTTQMLGTGVDIPSLETLIIAGDIKSSVLTQQAVGRILRAMEGKLEPEVLDFCDDTNRIFYRQAMERKKVYIQKGWPIKQYIRKYEYSR